MAAKNLLQSNSVSAVSSNLAHLLLIAFIIFDVLSLIGFK